VPYGANLLVVVIYLVMWKEFAVFQLVSLCAAVFVLHSSDP